MKFYLTFLVSLVVLPLSAQNKLEIEGRVVDFTTQSPIPYANIFNASLKTGTISNLDGYFKIAARSFEDSVSVSFIGYTQQAIPLEKQVAFYTIYLKESKQLLDEITITPKENSFLFDLIRQCRKNPPDIQTTGKAYLELKTFKDKSQMEHLESYYNADVSGYDLNELRLKVGRLALQTHNNRFFASKESSIAITKLKLLYKSNYFPLSPLNISKGKAKKRFYLWLNKKYLNTNGDSIYVIEYHPKGKSGDYYNGKIWINKTQNNFLKITQQCDPCTKHPFRPLHSIDSISNVRLNITKTFTELNNQPVFNHIDFDYSVDYKSRVGEEHELSYTISTNAVLYAYDFKNTFFIPRFAFNEAPVGDYLKINAFPYNAFFWKNNDEYGLNDQKKLNEQFFSDPRSLTNSTAFKPNAYFEKGIYEHPYIQWSENRIVFREVIPDTTEKAVNDNFDKNAAFKAQKYRLATKVFLDVNTYSDSTDILTATIFDPYESFYYLPVDNKALCFINIYFDLCEIERRGLEKRLKDVKGNEKQVQKVYDDFQVTFEEKMYQFRKAVARGTDEEAMTEWNKFVFENLGIDNIAIFKPFEEEE